MPLHPLWLALVALVPAGATWWTGRQVLRRIDDPALPELLMRRRGRMGMLWGVGLVAIVALGQVHAAWAVPLMIGAMMAASFPAQRVLLDERWGMGAYLWHSTRRLTGGLAFWMALVAAPMAVMGTRDSRLAISLAVGLAAALLLWLHHYRRFWLWTHAATPLGARAALDERFAAVMARATTATPLLFRFGQPGERRAAAFALPSASETGAVVFSDALLELLTPEETAAVFAHEVAHLEHYTPRRMRRVRVVASLLVVALLAVAVAVQRAAPGFHLLYAAGGAGVVMLALGVRASRSRGHETASDLRGAELCGDAEALVRALTKLHAALRLPRRWSADTERTATHPSLANRIAALRAAAAAGGAASAADSPAARFAPVVLPSTRAGGYVVMEASRIHLFDGVPADVAVRGEEGVATLAAGAADCRTLAYERLTRLTLEGDGGRGTRLVVVERGGGRWSVPLAPDDTDRARVALDMVDVRVGTSAPSAGVRRHLLAAIVVCAAAVVLLMARQLGVLSLLASGALFLPGAAPLAAAHFDPGTTPGRLARRDAEARVVSSAGLPGIARDLAVSPAGARYVVRVFESYDRDDHGDEGDADGGPAARMRLALGALHDGAADPVTIDGRAATFAGDDSLLVLAARRGDGAAHSLELRLAAIAGDSLAAPSWSVALPALLAPELRLDAATRRWRVTGRAADASRALVTLEGALGDTAVVRRVRAEPTRGEIGGVAAVTPLAGGWTLEARLRGDYRATVILGVLGATPWTTELSLFDGAAARTVAELPGFARCIAAATARAAACALTGQGGTSRVVVVDSSGRVETLAALAEPVIALAMGGDGRVALALAGDRALVILDPVRRTALHLALPADVSMPTAVQWTADGDVVIVGYSEGGTKVARLRQAVQRGS